jgi:[protein-PII] uridylyltransferase
MTAMELSTHDRRGLLSRVAQVLKTHRIRLHTARIATIGEEADDMLYITDELDQALTPAAEENLQRELTEALDQSQ